MSTERVSAALERLRAGGQAELAAQLDRLFAVIADQAGAEPSFAEALADAFGPAPPSGSAGPPRGSRKVGGRRPPGPFNPFEVIAGGEAELRRRLEALDVDQLKDIVAEHGMDYDRLALKWKTSGRLVERIVDTVTSRASKGEAFRGTSR